MWYEGFEFNGELQARSAYREMAITVAKAGQGTSVFYFMGNPEPEGDGAPPRVFAFVDSPYAVSDEFLSVASRHGGRVISPIPEALFLMLQSARNSRFAQAEIHN